jgi:hypothetical protein
MKNLAKHIFISLFSVLFIWIGAGGNYVTFHCFNCKTERIEKQAHSCCSDEKTCSDSPATADTHCCGENELDSHNPFTKNQNTTHSHRDGHCVYVIEYKLDIEKNVYKISIPSFDLFKSDLFSLFIPQKSENNSNRYTSFIPPRRSTNTFLSEICVFLI